jgi:4a-hydroxytetrahydrobiopterin dehydratase
MSVPDGWREEDDALVREFELASFPAAIAFVSCLAELAERENHHPDIDIRYKRVLVRWSTHSEGGVTERDREMAARTSACEPT